MLRRKVSWSHISLMLVMSAFLVMLTASTPDTAAQTDDIDWSQPINLSNTLQNSSHPAVVADNLGYVHVLWSEDSYGMVVAADKKLTEGDSIFYRRWDGEQWSHPVDVLYIPGEEIADYVAVAVDPANRLHAVWTGQSKFYYSSAPADKASSAAAWTKPIEVARNSARSSHESGIVVDRSGILHILYATRGDDAGVYHIRSLDGGASWGSAAKISDALQATEDSFSHVMVIADEQGKLHAVWQTDDAQGFGWAVYYARSVNGGETWAPARQLKHQGPNEKWVEWPLIVFVSPSQLHVSYTNGTAIGRSHQFSRNAGETWEEARNILSEMEGINGYNVLRLDGAGRLHQVINMRTRSKQVNGIYHSQWDGDRWTPVQPVDVTSATAPWAHHAAATVRLGNEIHIVYVPIPGFDIWHIRGRLNGIAPRPSTILPANQTPATPNSTPLARAQTPLAASAAAEPVRPLSFPDRPYPVEPIIGVSVGVGAALIIVAAAVLCQGRRVRRS